jgi:RNA polymerase sigma-70 factor (ECF subfamily)
MTDDRLSQLYRAYGSVIHDRCRSMLDDAAEAEDATHETFLRLHRQLARLPDAREAVFWIYRVATNYCLNEIRNRRRRAAPTDSLPEPAGAATDDPERPIADRELARRLIDGAPAKVRPVAWLYHVDGFQREEVSRILNISERTVTTRLATFASAARKYLRSNGL